MKISSIKSHVLRYELDKELGYSQQYYKHRTAHLVEIETDEGITGWGECFGPGNIALANKFIVEKVIQPLVIGEDPINKEYIWHKVYNLLRDSGQKGMPIQALSGIDIALWDLRGKVQGKSISEILGRKKDNLVPYASFVILSDPDERAQMSKTMLDEGWKAIKVRLHHDNEDLDVLTIKKIQDTVGGNLDILVDANQAQSPYPWQAGVIWDLDRAKRMNQKMHELGCYWLEEPRPRYNFDELSELVSMNMTKISGGENNTVVSDFHEMVNKNSYDILQPESMVMGGITPLIEIGDISKKYNKEIVPHHGGGDLGVVAHMHLLATWDNAPYCEMLNDPPLSSYRNKFFIFNEDLNVNDGIIEVPNTPGLGVTIKEDLIIRE